jgi:hypothetical protein
MLEHFFFHVYTNTAPATRETWPGEYEYEYDKDMNTI